MATKGYFNKKNIIVLLGFVAIGVSGLLLGANLENIKAKFAEKKAAATTEANKKAFDEVTAQVLPKEGFVLPISWGELGPKLISLGVINKDKFIAAARPDSDQQEILVKGKDTPITINSQNGQFVVDLLWAIGLAQKSDAYVTGPLGTTYKKEAGNFASTGGWTLARGNVVNYLGKYELLNLSVEQQNRVSEIAKNVYRPCCGNSAWFPDCNHGMAALAAIEMMVAKNLPDEEIYKNVLKLNSFWFPDTYVTNALYLKSQGISWDKVDTKEVLGPKYSSGQGAADIAKKVGPLPGQTTGGSCGA